MGLRPPLISVLFTFGFIPFKLTVKQNFCPAQIVGLSNDPNFFTSTIFVNVLEHLDAVSVISTLNVVLEVIFTTRLVLIESFISKLFINHLYV